ncbi:hypothetical protein KM043_000733 [Ampulex compressa]|nr:hypothetical protein KM043_000733 [Ampulex compressa]
MVVLPGEPQRGPNLSDNGEKRVKNSNAAVVVDGDKNRAVLRGAMLGDVRSNQGDSNGPLKIPMQKLRPEGRRSFGDRTKLGSPTLNTEANDFGDPRHLLSGSEKVGGESIASEEELRSDLEKPYICSTFHRRSLNSPTLGPSLRKKSRLERSIDRRRRKKQTSLLGFEFEFLRCVRELATKRGQEASFRSLCAMAIQVVYPRRRPVGIRTACSSAALRAAGRTQEELSSRLNSPPLKFEGLSAADVLSTSMRI